MAPRVPAPRLPVARVLPLLGVAHLDRVFDYQIDSEQDALAQPGVKVRVRFGGRLVDAILLERSSTSEHEGSLKWLERVISGEVVYPPQTRALVESVALRYGGVTSDVIRMAIPARHAKAEEAATDIPWEDLGQEQEPDLSAWSGYAFGESFVDAVLAGQTARAAWQVSPGEDWPQALAALAAKVVIDGGGALIVLPDQRDVDRLDAALRAYVGPRQITQLTASLGPQARYRRFLSILHGQARLVIGTRSAAFAPVKDLRLAVIMDDGDDNLVDPRAPYVHAREVLTTRSAQQHCALILGGYSRTAETQLLVESGWAHDLVAPREGLRNRSPYIHAVGDSDMALERDPLARAVRIPQVAFQALRKGLERKKPVLIQVPRKGYVPTLACGTCRAPARCRACNGPLGLPEGDPDRAVVPTCRWCGRPHTNFRCGECGSQKLRAVVLGTGRTAEELGRAFPSTRIITSGGSNVIDQVADKPAIVVATPGAEPVVSMGHYGAAVFLDTWALLGREDLRATEETLAKWMRATALVDSHLSEGEVVVVADPGLQPVQHLIRWDAVGAARLELEQRREVRFPPAAQFVAVDAPNEALDVFLDAIELPPGAELLGPVDLPQGVKLPGDYDRQRFGEPQRILIRAPQGPRGAMGKAIRAAMVQRAARKDTLPLRVQVDPQRIG